MSTWLPIPTSPLALSHLLLWDVTSQLKCVIGLANGSLARGPCHLTTYSHLAFGALRSLPPSLVTWIWSLKPIWWKNRPNSQVVSWPLHVYHGTYAQPPHTDKCHNYDNDNNDKNTVTFLILSSIGFPIASWKPSKSVFSHLSSFHGPGCFQVLG